MTLSIFLASVSSFAALMAWRERQRTLAGFYLVLVAVNIALAVTA